MIGLNFAFDLSGLNALEARLTNLAPAMERIGVMLVHASRSAFFSESTVNGAPWQPLAAMTQAQRSAQDYGAEGPKLRRTETLMNSVAVHLVSIDSVVVGTDLDYAAVHMTGRATGSAEGGPMPARPFLGVGPDEEAAMALILEQHLSGAPFL